MCDLHWDHLLKYEQTQLRQLFLSEMEKLRPEWMQEYRQGELRRWFERAVSNCDAGLSFRPVKIWLEEWQMWCSNIWRRPMFGGSQAQSARVEDREA